MDNGANWNIWNKVRPGFPGFYSSDQVIFGGGFVRVRASGQNITVNGITHPYRSGWMDTQNKIVVQGASSVRGRCRIVQRCNGVNFGFWMVLNQDGTWPPEIDIYEYPYAVDDGGTKFYSTVHTRDATNKIHSVGTTKTVADSSAWHEYRVDYTYNQGCLFFLDGVLIKQFADPVNQPSGDFRVILSTVVNNNTGWHGVPDLNDETWWAAQQCDSLEIFRWQ